MSSAETESPKSREHPGSCSLAINPELLERVAARTFAAAVLELERQTKRPAIQQVALIMAGRALEAEARHRALDH